MEPAVSTEIFELAERQATLCKVFSTAQRVLILWFLAEKERTLSEIAKAIGAPLPSTLQHLHLMGLSDFLESRRERQNIHCGLAENTLLQKCIVLANRPRENLDLNQPEIIQRNETIS